MRTVPSFISRKTEEYWYLFVELMWMVDQGGDWAVHKTHVTREMLAHIRRVMVTYSVVWRVTSF